MVEDISASDPLVIPASVLRRIPGCAGGETPLTVQLLHGGRNVNRNLRIDTREGRFVLRERIRKGPRPGADPLREVACHRAAAGAGVAPAVLDSAPDGGWILMGYVEGRMWTPARLRAPEGLRTLGACLQRLHAITPPAELAAFDPVSIATGQAQAILDCDPAAAAQVNALVARTRQQPDRDRGLPEPALSRWTPDRTPRAPWGALSRASAGGRRPGCAGPRGPATAPESTCHPRRSP